MEHDGVVVPITASTQRHREHIPHSFQAPERTEGILQWVRIQESGLSCDPRWYDVLTSRGKKSYEHHRLDSLRPYWTNLVPIDDCFPGLKHRPTTSMIYKYGIEECGYEDTCAGVLPELFLTLDQPKLRGLGYRYVIVIHDHIEILGLHRRMSFELAADFDPYFDPQDEDRLKEKGLAAFIRKNPKA